MYGRHRRNVRPLSWGTIHADPERARQIVLDLLSNTVKLTAPGGGVSVVFEPSCRWAGC
jgi:signal transduction histidine kinase